MSREGHCAISAGFRLAPRLTPGNRPRECEQDCGAIPHLAGTSLYFASSMTSIALISA